MHNLIDRHDLWLLSRATTFTATQFQGVGKYNTRSAQTISKARAAARSMLLDGSNPRPVAIYGVTPDGKSVFIENMDQRSELITAGEPMSIYILSYKAPSINQVVVYKMPHGADKVRASAFVGTLPEDYGAVIIETADDTRKLSGPLIVKLYNEIIKKLNKKREAEGNSNLSTPVKKFENLAVGGNRLFREAIEAAIDVPEDKLTAAEAAAKNPASHEPVEDQLMASVDRAMAVLDKEEKAKKTPRVPLATKIPKPDGTPRSKMELTKKIELLVAENPKVKTSKTYARFALYKTGQTVQEFLTAGGTLADVRWDVKMNFIKLVD